jgi:DNA-damage-inducible protein D
MSLNIPHYDNIIATPRTINGEPVQDFKMTRFACYIAVMNASPQKKEVALAQAYFAYQTRQFELFVSSHNEIDRLLIREEIIEGNKSLVSTAKQAGITDYAKFQNAGYLGMYNMHNWNLAKRRNVEKAKLMDSMGRTELAANLFRITQTEERIKNCKITGQSNLEQAHYIVGKEVRDIVIKNTGKTPEKLPQEKVLPTVKKELKEGYKKMTKQDKIKKVK